ncbi:AEC family transporter [uncultured Phascolarctobacterium sp.]|uniref:AEC family transporter n=1 Tax=uncultured Phascolarctobacterium sp. TaxID=512296 RepID=UPI0025FDB69D|nr:AEC family transporter [uncultured Phascolarctobacterium sp.]
MEQVLTKALAFVIIIAFGYLLKQRGFFKPDDYKLIAKIVLNITLPCAVITSFAAFKMEYTLFVLTLIGFFGNLLMIVWGFMLTRYQTNAAKIFYVFNLAGYNIGCFTLPFAQSFLGPFAVVATCMFDVGNSIMCTGGTYALASGLVHTGEKYEPVTLRSVAAKLLSSVPFVVYVLMLVCALFEVHLPQPVYTLTGLIGSANTFLSMLMIGMMFEMTLDLKKLKQVREVVLYRYVFGVALAWVCFYHAPLNAEVKEVLTLVFLAPSTAIAPIFIARMGGNVELAGFANSITIVISIILMTLFFTFLHV